MVPLVATEDEEGCMIAADTIEEVEDGDDDAVYCYGRDAETARMALGMGTRRNPL
jgi:hypothetical protein